MQRWPDHRASSRPMASWRFSRFSGTTGPAGLGQVHAVLAERRGVAITTVATMLKMMLDKEMVQREDGPRGYLWKARVSRKAAVSGLLGKLVQHVFDGSAHRLVAHLIEEGALDERERTEIMEILKSPAREGQETRPGEEGSQPVNSTFLTDSPFWTAAGWTMLHLVWVGAAIGADGRCFCAGSCDRLAPRRVMESPCCAWWHCRSLRS